MPLLAAWSTFIFFAPPSGWSCHGRECPCNKHLFIHFSLVPMTTLSRGFGSIWISSSPISRIFFQRIIPIVSCLWMASSPFVPSTNEVSLKHAITELLWRSALSNSINQCGPNGLHPLVLCTRGKARSQTCGGFAAWITLLHHKKLGRDRRWFLLMSMRCFINNLRKNQVCDTGYIDLS